MADPSHSSATASDALPASATPAHLPAAALLASATPAHPPHADLPAAALLASAVDTDALHAGHVASAAATDAPDAGFPAASTDPDMRFGFESEELGKEKTVGTVEERDLFVCYMGPEAWPSHLEATKSDRLPHLLAAAIKARKPEMMKLTELTICEEEGTESSLGDVLIFPDMIRYRGLTCSNVNTFVEEVLVKDADWHDGILEAIRGSYVFVCCHESKDNKCGASGPALIRKFKEGIEAQGLGPQVIVRSCAHLGGHECLGTVIIFSSDAKGEVTGHWYGYVSPDDVNLLLNKHMGQNETGEHIGRGQLGLSEEKNMEALELKRVKNGITVLKEAGTWTGGEDNLVCSLKDIMDLSSEEENLEIDFSKLKGTEAMLLAALAGDRVPQQVPPCPDAIRSESVAAVPLENIDVTTDVAKSNDMPPLEDSFANPVHENNGDDSTEDNGTIDEGPHIADVTVAIQRSEVEVLLQQAPSHQTAIIPQNANNENGAAEVNGHNTDGLEEENGGSEVPSAADRTILQRSEVAVQLQQAPSHQIAIIPQSAAAVPGASDSVDDMPPLEDDFGNIMKENNENGAAEVNGHNTDGLKEDNGRDEVPPAANTTILQIEHIQDPNAADPTDLRNGIIKRKLLIPANFNGEAVLDRSDLHKVRTAQELRNIIENTSGWLSTRISLALLVNGRVFQIPAHSVTDNLYTKAGAVCVVRGEELLHVPVDNRLYTRSHTAELSERRPQNSQISDMVIVKHEFRGNLWARRRYSVEGDDEYHLLQWLPKVADTKVKLQTKTQQVEEEAPVDDFSIKKCIAVVTTIEELSIDEKVGSFDIFKDENNRAIFLCADPDARLLWLRKQLSRVT